MTREPFAQPRARCDLLSPMLHQPRGSNYFCLETRHEKRVFDTHPSSAYLREEEKAPRASSYLEVVYILVVDYLWRRRGEALGILTFPTPETGSCEGLDHGEFET